MATIEQVIENALKNHSETDVWCRHCDARWTIIVPHTLEITDETKDKEDLWQSLVRNYCPRCGHKMTDTIKYRSDLTKEFEEFFDRPWNYEPV